MNAELQPRFDSLATVQQLDRHVVEQLREFVEQSPDEALFRINPLEYAARMGISEQQAINLFVAAVHVGLFEFAWESLCEACGGVLREGRSPADLTHGVHCALCDCPVNLTFDEAIEVSFTVSPRVRPIRFHQLHLLTEPEDIRRRFFSTAWTAGPEILAMLETASVRQALQPGGETVVHELELRPGAYRFINFVDNVYAGLQVTGERTELIQEFVVELRRGFVTSTHKSLRPGPVRMKVVNADQLPVFWLLGWVDEVDAAKAAIARGESNLVGPHMKPYLTGKRLLSNQLFRDLFRTVSLQPGAHFEVRSLTFLFTDLKGSTELYDRIGDLEAYDLVQAHFQILTEVVAKHEGAIVKTMGDAIMATFVNPADAVAAAREMHDRLEEWNRRQGRGELSLKVGIHTGGCIVVNAHDQLDYFGQTVNIAARIQGLAGSQETYLSEVVHAAPGVSAILAEANWELTSRVARLKGVSEEVGVIQATAIPS